MLRGLSSQRIPLNPKRSYFDLIDLGLNATVVVPPTDIPNVGRFAILVDAQGSATGILQP